MISNLKKCLSFIASATTVLVISGYVSLQPIGEYSNFPVARAQNVVDCTDFRMLPQYQVTPLVAEGDSGSLNFALPGAQYQACAKNRASNRAPAINTNGPVTFLQGWTWNTNFGDVSLACESDHFNLTAPCGNQEYGAYIVPSDDIPLRVMGFAWSDKMGWISMGCPANQTNTGVNCGATSYGVGVADKDGVAVASCPGDGPGGTLMAGDLYGFARTDSVGYINFCGAHVNLSNLQLVNPVITVAGGAVDTANGNDPLLLGARPAVDAAVVYANGNDYHEITLALTENKLPLTDSATRAVSIVMTDENTIKADQVTACGGAGPVCDTNTISKSAPTSPSNPFRWDANRVWTDAQGVVRTGLWYLRVSAVAPTDTTNQYIIHNITVAVDNPVRGERLATIELAPELNLSFAPPVQVTKIAGVNGAGNALQSETFRMLPNDDSVIKVKTLQKIAAGMPAAGTINIATHTYNCSNGDYNFIFDANNNRMIFRADGTVEDALLTADDKRNFPNVPRANVCGQGGALDDVMIKTMANFPVAAQNEAALSVFAQYSGVDAPDLTTVNALAFQTTVYYTRPADATHAAPYQVAYYSRQLKDGSLSAQAAKVEGNVGLHGVSTANLPDVAKTFISKTVGDTIQSNREPFLRAVKAVLGNSWQIQNSNLTNGAMKFAPNMGEFKILKSSDFVVDAANQPAPGILYYKHAQGAQACVIVINENPADLSPVRVTAPVTLVTEGCNIFIDRDIVTQRGANPGNLGIIALQDYSIQGANKGGNIYVCNAATDIEANIVAEGSLYSIAVSDPNVNPNCGGQFKATRHALLLPDGSPNPLSVQEELLNRQLVLVGSLMSSNTYGGSLIPPPNGPLLGSGKIAAPGEQLLSRMQDLNFLRFGRVNPTKLNPEESDDESPCWDNSFTLSKTLNPNGLSQLENCEFGDNALNAGTFNLKYRAPLDNQPIFELVK